MINIFNKFIKIIQDNKKKVFSIFILIISLIIISQIYIFYNENKIFKQSVSYYNSQQIQSQEEFIIEMESIKKSKGFYSILASHNGYEKRFGYTHSRLIKISKKEDIIFGNDQLKKTKNCFNSLNYFIRFHIYPNIKIVKTKAGNSILISLPNGEGWLMQSEMNNFEIEKNIFLGNKNKIINYDSVFISGNINSEMISIKWEIKRVN